MEAYQILTYCIIFPILVAITALIGLTHLIIKDNCNDPEDLKLKRNITMALIVLCMIDSIFLIEIVKKFFI